MVRWTSVGDAHLRQRQGVFGVYHHLVVTVRREDQSPIEDSSGLRTSRVPTETVDFSLDQLAMSWSDVLALVQQRLGKDVPAKREAGLFRKPIA
jgi:hypothetical protein